MLGYSLAWVQDRSWGRVLKAKRPCWTQRNKGLKISYEARQELRKSQMEAQKSGGMARLDCYVAVAFSRSGPAFWRA